MAPKKADNTIKGNKTSLGGSITSIITGFGAVGEQEHQICTGKFATDLEVYCRDRSPGYPVSIPVYVRGRVPSSSSSSQVQSLLPQNQQQQQQQQRSRPHSRSSNAPSVLGGAIAEEQSSTTTTTGKKATRPRKSSSGQSGILVGVVGIPAIDIESQSLTLTGQETSKASSSPYKTFHLLSDSDYFRPKILVDLVNNESESIDQISSLYIKAWQLDQHFVDILKKLVPLQEQLHTLNFCFVGLREQTINGLVELCHVIKNLKSLSLDGNPTAGEYFHRLIEKDDSKIVNLSLRFCDITDKGAARIAFVLGNISTQNWKLLTLNLSGNKIGDDGAISFATALRYNRTLISLNLSSNSITDKGALSLALVLRRIVLTSEEIVRRRYLLSERYAESHPDDLRYNTSSPTPSTVSTKSKSGRTDWKRVTDPNKRKTNTSKLAQVVADRRNRSESDDSRPSSRNKSAAKQNRNEGSSGRSSTLNTPSGNANPSRRPTTNTSNTNTKDSDQARSSSTTRVKKIATAVSTATKKNISIVKEEDEDAFKQGRAAELASSGKLISLQIRQVDHENPLIEMNESDSHNSEIWLRGNFVLLNLNLSRNDLTIDSVKQFLLSIEQQFALSHLNDGLNLSSLTTPPSSDFSGLCRLELKGMNDISIKSVEYQSLETLLQQKNPSIRFQQFREREMKESLDQHSIQTSQQLQPTLSDKITNTNEKTRSGSSLKMTAQRPASKLKE